MKFKLTLPTLTRTFIDHYEVDVHLLRLAGSNLKGAFVPVCNAVGITDWSVIHCADGRARRV